MTPHTHRPHHPWISALFGSACLLLAGACSSGGSDRPADAQGPTTLDLVITSRGNTPAQATVTGVMLEDPSGTISPNLLDAPRDVQLVDATGQPAVLALGAVPPMEVRAVHIGFASTAPAAVAAGANPAVIIPIGLSAPAVQPIVIDDSGGRRLAELDLPDVGTPDWWTTCRLRDDRGIDLPGAECEVLQVDPGNQACDVLWRHGGGSHPFTLGWQGSTVFSDDSGPRGDDSFMAGIQVGERLDLACTIRPGAIGTIHRCHRPGVGFGDEGKLLGSVQAVQGSRVTVALVAIRRLPLPDFGPLGSAIIFETAGVPIRSDYAPWVVLSPDDLVSGDILEIEVRQQDPIAPGVWRAHEVELEDHPGSGAGGQEVEGQVGAVDLGAQTITMLPRGNDPLLVGGIPRTQAIAEVTATTWLYLDDPDRPIALSQVQPGQRIWVKGPTVAAGGDPPRVTGREIRIRND